MTNVPCHWRGREIGKDVISLDRRKIAAGICIAAGIVLLAVPFCYHFEGKSETDRLTQQFEQTMEEKQDEETKQAEEDTEAAISEEEAALFAEGDVIAILEILALDIRYPVVEGCASADLKYAIGHMSETAGIGKPGNCVLAGHNGSRYGTYFTHLNRIEAGDEVKLLDASGEVYRYSVTDSFVVGPYYNTIKEQGKETELTLFTCAERGTKRFVVKCEPME